MSGQTAFGAEHVTLVDLDPEMTKLSNAFPLLAKLNQNSFNDPRVQVINEDAFIWVEKTSDPLYDAAIVDFPDPNTFALGKLYTTRFYRLLKSRLTENAAMSVQSTSPMFARNCCGRACWQPNIFRSMLRRRVKRQRNCWPFRPTLKTHESMGAFGLDAAMAKRFRTLVPYQPHLPSRPWNSGALSRPGRSFAATR